MYRDEASGGGQGLRPGSPRPARRHGLGRRPVSAPGVRLFLIQCIRTQATVPKPAFVASNRVCQRPQPVAVHRADPASRDAKDALFLFILPGVWASLPRHAKDPVWFVSVTGHWPTSDAAEAGRSLAAVHQHGPAVTYGANATAPRPGPGAEATGARLPSAAARR